MIYLWLYIAGVVLFFVISGICHQGLLFGFLGFFWPIVVPIVLLYLAGEGISKAFQSGDVTNQQNYKNR